jgi:hypothetical protein
MPGLLPWVFGPLLVSPAPHTRVRRGNRKLTVANWTLTGIVVGILLPCVLVARADEATCDDKNPPTCCKTWRAKATDSRTGELVGTVAAPGADTYQNVVRETEKDKHTDAHVCKGLGRQDSSCFRVYSQPYCLAEPKSNSPPKEVHFPSNGQFSQPAFQACTAKCANYTDVCGEFSEATYACWDRAQTELNNCVQSCRALLQ